MTFAAILAAILPQILPTIFTLFGGVITWAAAKLAASATSKNKAVAAAANIGNVGLSIANSIWTKVAPEVQAALADGVLTADERAHLISLVTVEVTGIDVNGTVSKIASDLGLPLSGVIGTIAEWVINHYAQAHDQNNPNVSDMSFPVAQAKAYAGSATPPAGVGVGR